MFLQVSDVIRAKNLAKTTKFHVFPYFLNEKFNESNKLYMNLHAFPMVTLECKNIHCIKRKTLKKISIKSVSGFFLG